MKKHNDENNQHCPECLRAYTRKAALNEHLRQEHDWKGAVKRPTDIQEGGVVPKKTESPTKYYDIKQVGKIWVALLQSHDKCEGLHCEQTKG